MDAPTAGTFEWISERIARCEDVIWAQLLQSQRQDHDCILDLGFSEPTQRQKFYDLLRSANLAYELHYLSIPCDERWRRVERRNKNIGAASVLVTKETFDWMESYFVAPSESELRANSGVVITEVPFLETSRVILREPREDEARFFFELDQDPEVMRYLSDGRPTSMDEARASMERVQTVLRTHAGRLGLWWAFKKDTGEFLGWFHFRPGRDTPTDDRNIELGYRLKQKFWRQGFTVEVSQALLELGFRSYGIEAVFAVTMKQNLASRGVMEKLGLQLVGEYVEELFPGSDKRGVRYLLKRADWVRSRR